MSKTKEAEKSFYELLITELPIIITFSAFIIFRSFYSKLSTIEIFVIFFILLPLSSLTRFLTINFITKSEIDNLKLMRYLAFSGIPSYSVVFIITLLVTQAIFGKISLLEIILLTIAFLSATVILSLLSLGILIDEYFDPRKSRQGIDIVKIPVIVTVFSFIASIAIIFSIVLTNAYLKTNFSIFELIILNVLVALSVYITSKKIYSTVEKDIAKIRKLLLEKDNNSSEQKDIEMYSEELKELQKVIQRIEADYKLKNSITRKVINNSKEELQKIKENLSKLLETIEKYQKSNIETTSLRYTLNGISTNLANSIESLESIQSELIQIKRDEKVDYIKKILEHLTEEREAKTKIIETLNSVQENLKKVQDKLSILYRDIPNFINNTDKIYNLVEEIRNIGFKLNNLSVTLDIELAKTKYEKQKLSVISGEIRKISETISKILSTIKVSEVENHKVTTEVSSLLDSFSSLDTTIKELAKTTSESLENIKKSLATLSTISERFSTLTSSIDTTGEEINSITSSLIKLNYILPESKKDISSFNELTKKMLEGIPELKTEIEEKIKEINQVIKELEL
jgi:methyl-accepting chemotaxis protein